MEKFVAVAKKILHETLMFFGCIAEMLRIKFLLTKDEKIVYALCNTLQQFMEDVDEYTAYVKCSDKEVDQIIYDFLNHYTSKKYQMKLPISLKHIREEDPRFKGKSLKGVKAVEVWDELSDFYQEHHYPLLVDKSNLCNGQKANRTKIWNASEVIQCFLDFAEPDEHSDFYYGRI